MATTIRWLHLTDLHVGMSDQDWLWPQVRTKFRDDLKKIRDLAGPWDLVLFSGDFVQSGTEYAKLDAILDEIWSWFADLGCDPKLLAVPGNHDLQWRDAKDPVVKQLYRWAADADTRQEFWNPASERYRHPVIDAFAAYDRWWRGARWKPNDVQHGFLPGDFSWTFVKDGFRLGIAGLNSAFLQLTEKRDDGLPFEGQLALHPHQFHRACDGDGDGIRWAESHHACFLMTHHPPQWLTGESRQLLHGQILGSFQLHLCGHNHETDVLLELSGGVRHAPLRWQGRSLFGLEKLPDGKLDRSHGYVAGELRLGDDFRGELQFMPRELRRHGKAAASLVPDHDAYLPDDRRTDSFPIQVQRIPIARRRRPEGGGDFLPADEPAGTGEADLLPKVTSFLQELPTSRLDLHDEIVTALQQEIRNLGTSDEKAVPLDILELVRRHGVNDVLDALYRWLDRPSRGKISVDGWREVLTHLVVLAAANPDWLPAARGQRDREGVVTVGERLYPLSAAVLISGLFDIAIRLDGRRPAGHIPVASGRGSRGPDGRDRYQDFLGYLQDEARKFFPAETLDEQGIRQMLLTDSQHNNPRFVYLPEGDSLAREISERLKGLVTVLLEKEVPESQGASGVLDQSLRLVRNIHELLEKLK